MPGWSPALGPRPGPCPWPMRSSTSPTSELPSPSPTCCWSLGSKRNLYSSRVRIGTRTIFLPSLVMIDCSLTMSARFWRIASLTFCLWRAWSIAPLRWRDQSFCVSVTVNIVGPPRLPVEQRADVLQQLVGADRAIALLPDQPIDHVVDAAELVGIRSLGRRGDLDHVAQVGEQLLLDGLLQALVRLVVERLPAAGQRRDADQDLLTELALAVLRDADLLLDRAHEPLVRLHLLLSDGVDHLGLVAVGLDVVEVVVEEGASRFLEGVDECLLHLALGHLVVLAAGLSDQVQQPFVLLTGDARWLR